MTPELPNDGRTKERVNFRSRLLLVYIAGVYLLFGAVGNYFLEWFESDEIVWHNFVAAAVVAVVFFGVLSLVGARMYRTINRHIDQIGESS